MNREMHDDMQDDIHDDTQDDSQIAQRNELLKLSPFYLIQVHRERGSVRNAARFLKLPYNKYRLLLMNAKGVTSLTNKQRQVELENLMLEKYREGLNDSQIARVIGDGLTQFRVTSWRMRSKLPKVKQSGRMRTLVNKDIFAIATGGCQTTTEFAIVKLLDSNPTGLTTREIATKMDMQLNYMFNVLKIMRERKLIRKEGKLYKLETLS